MTTLNNRNVSLSHRKYGASRAIRNVSPPSGKSEDPKQKSFLNRSRKGGKSYWDWMDFFVKLAIPLVVLGVTVGFGWWQGHLADVQHRQDQQRALDQQQATILQTYIDNIQDLLLNHNLLKSKPDDDVAIVARARTLTALQGLDPQRKGRLVQFLYEAKLIGFQEENLKTIGPIHGPIIYLFGGYHRGANLSDANLNDAYLNHADLSGANLTGATLNHASLSGANLTGATLNHASLSGADLSGADLKYADLIQANLSGAFLSNARLWGANLSGANLSGADLSEASLDGAQNLTQQQFDQVHSCKDEFLPPPGLTCHQNQ